MALQDLINQIEKDLKKEILQLEKDAEVKLDQLAKEASETISELKEKSKSDTEKSATAISQKKAMLAKMESKRLILETKREKINEAYSQAVKMLDKLPEGKQVDLLSAVLVALGKDVDTGKIYPAKGKKSLIKKALEKSKAKFSLADKEADTEGGFILKTEALEIDASYQAIVDQVRPSTEKEVIATLF